MGRRNHARSHQQNQHKRVPQVRLVSDVTRSAGGSSAPELSVHEPASESESQLIRAILPCEIRIVDEEKREVEVCATSEAVDSYGTVFSYEASKDAFNRWAGNVREMHERKAVGRKVAVRFDDSARKVYARIRISKGAEDTWEKVKDGTLAGASIGASDVEWRQQRLGDQDVPVATRYDLVELSLVDLPSNPDALGVTFVRDGVPDDALLDDLSEGDGSLVAGVGIADDSRVHTAAAAESDAPHPQPDSSPSMDSTTDARIDERDGSLSLEDPAVAIAAAALKRGQSEIAAPAGLGSVGTITEPTVKQRRLAALGAPDYARKWPFPPGLERASSSAAPDGYGVEQPYDMDGDHETAADYIPMQSGPRADDLVHAADSHGHVPHAHAHTGDYGEADAHRHPGPHMHVDGTSHEHDHLHDHAHHEHASDTQPSTAQVAGSMDRSQARSQDRVQSGHAHTHAHNHDHGHYYRVADGSPLDFRLVSGEQVRTHEYVSTAAFRAAGGSEGKPLTADQFRVAAAHDLRELGPYSRNPGGPADAGTPDEAPIAPSADMQQSPEGNGGSPALDRANLEDELRRTGECPLCHGQVRALDRDGNPIAGADANGQIAGDGASTGMSDVSTPPNGWDGRTVVAEITRDLTRSLQPQYAALAGSIRELAERLQRIEQTPQSGGPVLRAADRGSAFAPGGYSAGGKPGAHEQYAALESLAGKLADPQAQVAVAAEMIRLQQEAAGMTPAMQVMPRAGQGWKSAGQ